MSRPACAWCAILVLAGTALASQGTGDTAALRPAGTEILDRLRLERDDVLQLRVVGEADLSGQYVVRDDGRIQLPIVGEISLAGLTLAEATVRIREALLVPIIDPQISLELVKAAPRRIYVSGEVLRPGVLEWREAATLSKALTLAGGLTERGDVRNVRVRRGEREFAFDLSRLVREGEFAFDSPLEAEDQVLVPERPRVTILGPVPGAGIAYFEEGDTLYQLLSERGVTRRQVATGGATDVSPAELRYVRVMRGEKTTIVNLDIIRRTGDPANDIPLVRGDRIIIADRGEVFVAGRVARPGAVDTRQATTATRALTAAGGALPDSALDRCIVVHEGQARQVDLARALEDADTAADVELVAGDLLVVPNNQVLVLGAVGRPGQYGLTWRCRLTDALAAAGGPALNADLRKVTVMRAGRPEVFDMSGAFDTGVAEVDPALSPEDVVIVPEAWVYLVGAALRPGALPYRQARTLRELLAACGGVSESAQVVSTFIVRGGESRKVDIGDALRGGTPEADVPLEPGDRVVISELLDQRVYITGQVQRPQALRVEDAPTVAKAVALAGGVVRDAADLARVRVLRGDRVLPVDLRALLYEGDLSQDLALEAGDTLVVPENEQGFVYLFGQVNRPGPVKHFDGIRLSQALAAAGGYTVEAMTTEVLVAREEGGQRVVHRVPFSGLFQAEDDARAEVARRDAPIGPPTGYEGHIPEAVMQGADAPDIAPDLQVGADLEPDPVLSRGDVVFVPERKASRARRTILPWLGEISYWLGRVFSF